MTSRERVNDAIRHKETDRIPIDLGGFNASTILAEAYAALLKHLHVEKPVRIGDTAQFWVLVDTEIQDRFHADVTPCYPLFDGLGCRRDLPYKRWVLPRGTPVELPSDFSPESQPDGSCLYRVGKALFKLPAGGFYFDLIEPPFSWVRSVRDVERVEIPVFSDAELAYMRQTATRLRKESERFIVAEIFGGWCDIAGPWLGNEQFYMSLLDNPSMVHALFERMTDVWIRKVEQLVCVLGDDIDAVPVYNDLGHNLGGMYRSETVRTMVIPYLRRFLDHVERVSRYHIILHSCGSVYQYIPDLIDAGVRILNPVQVSAQNMEAGRLKKEFGRDLVFWGGAVDAQHTLAFGTPAQVREEARRNIQAFKPGGGFIFNNPHNIQSNVKPENVVALYRAAEEFGRY